PPVTTRVLDDHVATAVDVVSDPAFYRPGMTVRVGNQTVNGASYIRIIRRIAGSDSWPEVLVMYADGYLRLKPQAQAGGGDPAFGSSVVVGPAVMADRPYADVQSIPYLPTTDSLVVTYRSGGRAVL